MNEKNYKIGLDFSEALTLLFIAFKLAGIIDWSWVWVLAPAWITLLVVIIVILVITFSYKIPNYINKRRFRKALKKRRHYDE